MDLNNRDIPFTVFGMGPIQRIEKTDAGKIFEEFSMAVLDSANGINSIHDFLERHKDICIEHHEATELQSTHITGSSEL